jgi:uncharacterized damage-inducible protein DinB
MKQHLRRMLDAMVWADRRVIDAVAGCPAAEPEAMPLLAHVLAAEHVWLARLERRSPRLAVWPTLTLAECTTLAEENAAAYANYVGRLTDAGLAEMIEYRNQMGDQYSTAAIDILTQVITHGGYHRGQIAKIIGRTGDSAPNTDFITYVRSLASPES